jgi:hypothetical protein
VTGPTRRGPQRRTHSSAAGSLRSVPPGQQRRSIAETSRSVSSSALVETDSMCPSICGSRRWPAMGDRDTPHGGGCNRPVPGATPEEARRRRDPGPVSGGLWNARDAFLIEPHLSCDLVVRDTFGLAQIVDDQAGLNGVALKLLVLAEGRQLLGRAV